MKSITTDRTIDNNKQPDYDTAFDEIKNSRKFGKDKKVRVIPGFHLTLGITVTMLSLIVLIPLASVMVLSLIHISPCKVLQYRLNVRLSLHSH